MFTNVVATLSILQPQFIERGLKKTENSEQNVVLLLLFYLRIEMNRVCVCVCVFASVRASVCVSVCVCVCV